jgi:peptidoglycan hydrolase CwlO-like protein
MTIDMDIIIPFLTSTITGIVTYFVGFNRSKKETESIVLQNLEKSISLYQVIVDDMGEQVRVLNDKINGLQNKVDELLKENKHLKDKIEDYYANSSSQGK